MSLLSRVQSFFGYADTPKEIDIISEKAQIGEMRQVEPPFPLYSNHLIRGSILGISDHESITEREQRLAWRGVFSTCVQMRANEISKALCNAQVKRKLSDKEFEDVEEDHPWKLLWENPSMNYDKFFFFEQVSKLRDFGKGAYLAVFRESQFQVVESMEIVYPYFGDMRVSGNTSGGIDGFVFTSNGGTIQEIPRKEMLWMRHGHPVTPYESSSLIMRGTYESDISLFQSVYMRDMSKEGNIPHVYATSDQDVTPTQRDDLGRLLTKEYRTAGVSNKKTLFLGSGTKLETIAMSPDEMQAIDSIGLNNNQIYIICEFPPEMFAENGTLANSKEGRMKWLQNSIQKEVDKLCMSFTHQLKIAFGAQESDLCIVPPDVVPKDPLELQRVREIQWRTGQRNANDFLMEDGMETYPEGDLYFVGGGVRPVRDLAQEPENETETTVDEEL